LILCMFDIEINVPKKRIFGHTWVGWLNLILFRWLFLRLAYRIKSSKAKTFLICRPPWKW
jgi:hypothetical protein